MRGSKARIDTRDVHRKRLGEMECKEEKREGRSYGREDADVDVDKIWGLGGRFSVDASARRENGAARCGELTGELAVATRQEGGR